MWEQYLTCLSSCVSSWHAAFLPTGTQALGRRLLVKAEDSPQAQQHARLWRLGVPHAVPAPSPLAGSIGHQPTCLEWRGRG